MTESHDDAIERPATWENVIAGKAKEALGHLTGDEELTEEGEDQEAAAHRVREEYREEKQDR